MFASSCKWPRQAIDPLMLSVTLPMGISTVAWNFDEVETPSGGLKREICSRLRRSGTPNGRLKRD